MCFQRFEVYASCQHINLEEKVCGEAAGHTLWERVECKNYHSEEHQNTQDKCGDGRYYCRFDNDGTMLDDMHQSLKHAKAMVPWTQAQCDNAFDHLQKVERAFQLAKVSLRAQSAHQAMIDAVREHRKKAVALARAHYMLDQYERKAFFAESHFRIAVPAAMQQGIPVPSLVLPLHEPWKAPPFDYRPSSAIYPSNDYPDHQCSAINASGPRPYPPSMQRALKHFTPTEDLGTLVEAEWFDSPSLDTLPIGCLSGDRSTAISELAKKTALELREHGNVMAQAYLSQPKSAKRKRTRANTKRTKIAHANPVKPTTTESSDSASKDQRSEHHTKDAGHADAIPSSQGNGSDSKSAGSLYFDMQAAGTLIDGAASTLGFSEPLSTPQYLHPDALLSQNDLQSSTVSSMPEQRGTDAVQQQSYGMHGASSDVAESGVQTINQIDANMPEILPPAYNLFDPFRNDMLQAQGSTACLPADMTGCNTFNSALITSPYSVNQPGMSDFSNNDAVTVAHTAFVAAAAALVAAHDNKGSFINMSRPSCSHLNANNTQYLNQMMTPRTPTTQSFHSGHLDAITDHDLSTTGDIKACYTAAVLAIANSTSVCNTSSTQQTSHVATDTATAGLGQSYCVDPSWTTIDGAGDDFANYASFEDAAGTMMSRIDSGFAELDDAEFEVMLRDIA